jgi:hypothetical protein
LTVITYWRLGTRGRLGNQLWQIASTLGIAARVGDEVRFPPWAYAQHFSVPARFFGAVEEDAVDAPNLVHHLPEVHRPYLQDLRLWMPIEADVRRYFNFQEQFLQAAVEKFRSFIDTPTTAVHVRRGDYQRFPDHFSLLSPEYYARALERFGGTQILVFSDDPGWCKTNLTGLGSGVAMTVGTSDIVDLALMTLCRHHVIANSSFSWWGAALSGGREVCYPSPWFGAALDHDRAALFPPGWVPVPA